MLAKDLKEAFPDMKGFSKSNLKYMRQFAETYTSEEISQQAVGQITWSHNIKLFSKVKDQQQRFRYAQKAIEN